VLIQDRDTGSRPVTGVGKSSRVTTMRLTNSQFSTHHLTLELNPPCEMHK